MKKTYYLFNPGRMTRKDNTLKFTPVDKNGVEQKPRYLPVEQVDEMYVFGALDANSSLYNFLGKHQVPVHYFDYYENYTGSFMPREALLSGKVLLAQSNFCYRKAKRLPLARAFIDGGSFNMRKNLNYYARRGKAVQAQIDKIDTLRQSIEEIENIDELMGIEGNIRKAYYAAFDEIIKDFVMQGRSYRPPENEINALISFGNMMCYSQCLRAIHRTQLNPTISFLHQPGERRFSLALDLAEIFKPILVDRLIFRMLNKKEIQANDFEDSLNRIVLKPKAKKKFVQAWEGRLSETIQHRTLKRNVSYKHLMKLEVYKLMKHIMNIQEYKPLKMYW
ncbi:MAG: type I-B CRISPR-associated endonuclease Cas1b [Bacteroidota bacterium]|nr:type I-B CRISPR-associated endonuclease Cas1b [Bacteroidota bacterium]